MQSFLNSPQGPQGAAGQAGTSTMPQNLFNNAGGFGSRFGAGVDNFQKHLSMFNGNRPMGMIQNMFQGGGPLSHLFGGDGGILGGMFGQKGLGGIPQNLSQIPQNLASIFTNQGQQGANAPTGTPGSAGASSGGFLSRFMRGNNGQA